ncbi:unnamed protein product [Rhizopus stolonifer]
MECTPTENTIQWIHALFGSCVEGYGQVFSFLFGYISIFCWLCAQVPQMIENYMQQSAEGLSQYLLYFWLAGDLANVISCFLNHQLPFQIYLAAYYCMTDFILLFQYFLYRKPKSYSEIKQSEAIHFSSESPKYGSTVQSHTQLFGLFIFGFQVTQSVRSEPVIDTTLLGCVLAWTCTTFYLCSRIPQIIKNYQRHSVQGLSLALFSFAVGGNVTYALSIILRPGHTKESFMSSLPYIVSSFGTLLFDLVIFIQFLHYNKKTKVNSLVP